jgi:ferredoxin/flavodoxin---NADP+ reductase
VTVALVGRRRPGVVDLSGWQAIEREERRRGAEHGRPRVKIVEIDEMLRIAHEQARHPVDGPSRAVPGRLVRRARQLEDRS